mmetsp:Transcript_9060/g.24400  ORF Transcript_9060/g.24400 Transcript_9060/m.24400 type:complete len:289 (-) Transcript_9060:2498-3364(-)
MIGNGASDDGAAIVDRLFYLVLVDEGTVGAHQEGRARRRRQDLRLRAVPHVDGRLFIRELEPLGAVPGEDVPPGDRAVDAGGQHRVLVFGKPGRLHKALVTPKLFEHLAALNTVDTDFAVERRRQNLVALLRERQGRDAVRMCRLERLEALATAHLPDLDGPSFVTGGQQHPVRRDGHAQHGRLVHHKLLVLLILQILFQGAGERVPHLDKPVVASGDKPAPVGQKRHAFGVALRSKTDGDVLVRREGILFIYCRRNRTAEHVECRARWEQALLLLPLDRLAYQHHET